MKKTSILTSKIKGESAPFLSLSPLKEAESIAKSLVSYLEEKRIEHKASVFRIHAGLKTVVCLDHVSAEFYFKAPREILERENKPRFGPIAVRPEFLNNSCPALISSNQTHDCSRKLTDAILEMRADQLPIAFEKVTQRLFEKWRTMKDVPLYDALLEWSSNIACNWILGMDISLENVKAWTNNAVTVNTDTLFTQMLGKLMLPKCPRAAIQVQQKMDELINQSPLFPQYEQMAKEYGVDTKSLSSFLNFLCLFNGTGAPTFSIFYAIAKIYSLEDLKGDLQTKLQGLDESEMLKNPFLDHVFYEVMRLNTRPRIFYKRAQQDFEMPAANGKSYLIKKGELVLIPAPIAHRDANVFHQPDNFLPIRYAHNPSLKNKVFGYGILPNANNPYGCAAAKNGQSEWIWKKMLTEFITKASFSFNIQPTFDFDAFFNFRPRNIKLLSFNTGNISPNQETTSSQSNEIDLNKRFSEVSDLVRLRKVKFNKKQYLSLYGLYKQALDGNNTSPMPGAMKVLGRQKWMAWNALQEMSSSKAMEKYVFLVEKVQNLKPANKKVLVAANEGIGKERITSNVSVKNERITPIIQLLSPINRENVEFANIIIKGKQPEIDAAIKLGIIVVGKNGNSSEIVLLLKQVTKDLSEATFCINCKIPLEDVGKPEVLYCSFSTENNGVLGHWYIDEVCLVLEEINIEFNFAVHATINIPDDNIILFESKGVLPQDETKIQQKARELFLEKNRNLFQWEKEEKNNIPNYAKFEEYGDLPLDEQFEEKIYAAPTADTQENEEDLPPASFNYYLEKTKLNDREIPRLAEHNQWKEDEEFGRLYLQGTHCNFIKQCKELPLELNVDKTFFVPKAKTTLATLLKKGLVYIADYVFLKDATPPKGRYLSAPIVLFFSEITTETLWPIIIQLERDETAPFFTPEDSASDWLMAKMGARVADISMHQMASHFLLTHAVSEAFAMAANRNFSTNHPINQLLAPHFKYIFGISVLARIALISDGGWIDRFGSFGGAARYQIMEKAYQSVSLKNTMNFPRDLKTRGVGDNSTLPNYAYRDDGLLIWAAIETYVNNTIRIHYTSDKQVQEDFLLKKWLKEFKEKGYQFSDWSTEMNTIEELVDLLTSIIFNATLIHGSMNFFQYEVYGFVPNSPAALFIPPPRKKGLLTEADILAALPGNQTALIFLFLSQQFEEDIKLANHKTIFSSDPNSRYALLKFRKELKKIEQIIIKRNKQRKIPYEAALPSNIPNSIDL